MIMNANYRIDDVQTVRIGGKDRICFKAFRRESNAPFSDQYIFVGEFTAPKSTSKTNLWKFVDETKS
jgi:hypothetical protein